MGSIKESAVELIGGTPILKISRYSAAEGVEGVTLLAKLEYLNPAGSVKDRIALAMIEDAEEKGILKPVRLSSNQLPVTLELVLQP